MFDYLLQRKIKSGLKKLANRRQRSFLNYNKIHRVLIFFDAKDADEVKNVVEDLKKNGKEVILWTFGNDSMQLTSDVKVINPTKDLSLMHTLRPEIVTEFCNFNYDTFFDLSLEDNVHMLYLKIKNTAQFSIGLRENDYKLYDFILLKEDDKSLFETYEQVKFYLINNT